MLGGKRRMIFEDSRNDLFMILSKEGSKSSRAILEESTKSVFSIGGLMKTISDWNYSFIARKSFWLNSM